MKKILISLLLITSTFTFLNAESKPVAKSAAAQEIIFSIKDIAGKEHKVIGAENGLIFPEYKGKAVILEFFGHKCPPCLASIPHLVNIQKKHKDKVAIIAIEVQGLSEAELKNFVAEKKINYHVSTNQSAGQFVNYVAQRAQWSGSIPFTVMLDGNGEVQLVQPGMIPEAALEELVIKFSAVGKTKTADSNATVAKVKKTVKTKEGNTSKK